MRPQRSALLVFDRSDALPLIPEWLPIRRDDVASTVALARLHRRPGVRGAQLASALSLRNQVAAAARTMTTTAIGNLGGVGLRTVATTAVCTSEALRAVTVDAAVDLFAPNQ